MILADMAQHVVETIGSPDAESLKQAKRFLKTRYGMIYNSHLWEQSKVTARLTAYDNEVILPAWLSRVLQVVLNKGAEKRLLPPMDRQNVFQIDPTLLVESGELIGWSALPTVASHTHPGGHNVTIESSDGSDTGSARLWGIHNGNEIGETLILSGTNAVTSANLYDELTTLSKPGTTGNVTVKTNESTPREVQVLLAEENERRHLRIQLHRDFTDGQGLYVLGKHRCVPLVHDNDSPQLADCESALLAYATADMWSRMRQVGKAQAREQEAHAHVQLMMGMEKNQAANVVRFVPED